MALTPDDVVTKQSQHVRFKEGSPNIANRGIHLGG